MKTLNLKTKKLGIFLLLFGLLFLCGCQLTHKAGKYAQAENWAFLPEKAVEATDVFFIAPTVFGGGPGEYTMSLSDEATKENFIGATKMEKGIYDQNSNFYAPYYQQKGLAVYDLSAEEQADYTELAYADIKEAFTYYLDHYNNGRPIILAGFSQGSEMGLLLLEDMFAEEDLQKQLISAYLPGWAVTDEELQEYPHLKLAEAEEDTGCIITFNSEDEATTETLIVPEKTHSINPLNWKTDATPADAALNLGACFTDYSGEPQEEIKGLCGAYIDETRGTLKITGITPEQYPTNLPQFGPYHVYEYMFFYRNLQKNVAVRIQQYEKYMK